MRTLPLQSPGMLLYLVALVGAPVSGGLEAQVVLDCKCTQPAPGIRGGQRFLVLQGGGWMVDMDATVGAARAELPLGQSGRWLFVPGLTFAHGSLRTGPTQTDVLVPEALFHFQLTQGRFRPYLGAGAGLALVNLFDRTFNAVVTAASGLRVDLTPRWGARVEADLRISGFEAGTVGWGVGIARRF